MPPTGLNLYLAVEIHVALAALKLLQEQAEL